MTFNIGDEIEYLNKLWRVVGTQKLRYMLQNKAGKIEFAGEVDLVQGGAIAKGRRVIADIGEEPK